ncbi:hypothetical protein OBV_42570 [Oscillibacter valericigenes Sjm18-20]|nr:hypothetical protein OBV_42570 [Oscillibacter valericigenes Sjm18-20]
MNIVGYGGGTNSTAMLIGLQQRDIPVDLILFSDTGCEQPHTYDYLPVMNRWLSEHGMPEITPVEYTDQNGDRLTLEDECLRSGTLPAIAYGYKKCSLKHKVGPQDKFCNHYQPCLDVWKHGGRVTKFIGFDAGEERRRDHAIVYDMQDKKYKKEYPLIDWGWFREDCIVTIKQEGLPLPGKSSCFFCPSMKKSEIRTLYHQHRDLYDRAIAIENGAKPNLIRVKGLGRDWSWQDFVEADKNQTAMCWMFPETDMPCGCYDGD